jgi:hypothetical protein
LEIRSFGLDLTWICKIGFEKEEENTPSARHCNGRRRRWGAGLPTFKQIQSFEKMPTNFHQSSNCINIIIMIIMVQHP